MDARTHTQGVNAVTACKLTNKHIMEIHADTHKTVRKKERIEGRTMAAE